MSKIRQGDDAHQILRVYSCTARQHTKQAHTAQRLQLATCTKAKGLFIDWAFWQAQDKRCQPQGSSSACLILLNFGNSVELLAIHTCSRTTLAADDRGDANMKKHSAFADVNWQSSM